MAVFSIPKTVRRPCAVLAQAAARTVSLRRWPRSLRHSPRRATPSAGLLTWLAAAGLVVASWSGLAANAAEPADAVLQQLQQAGVSGGLLVEVGCDSAKATAALAADGRFVVQSLEPNAERVQQARKELRSAGVYGPVSVCRWSGQRLPFAENLVNAVVVRKPELVSRDELLRVLTPGGVALLWQQGKWTAVRKERPSDVDEWSHFLHGPDNNAVAHDERVGPPRRLQWLAEPRHARSHEHLATVSTVVTSGGRVFLIVDEGPTESVLLPSKWSLVARDAYNGLLLWKRPISRWESQLRGFRTGPPQVKRRLVADGDFVYVTLGYGEPVSQLDAATGKTLQVYAGTENTEEILLKDGVLYLVVGDPKDLPSPEEVAYRPKQRRGAAARRGEPRRPSQKSVLALRADTGQRLWQLRGPETVELLPLTLAVGDGRVFFHNAEGLVCVDASSGRVLWKVSRPVARVRPAWSVPTVVVHQEVVLVADRKVQGKADRSPAIQWVISIAGGGAPAELTAYSAETGQVLWSYPCAEGYNAPVDVLVADGLVWVGTSRSRRGPDYTEGRDPHTGEVKRRLDTARAYSNPGMAHHRCYRDKATDRFIFSGRAGTELIGLRRSDIHRNQWLRGTCQYGVLPANGLLYAPPDSCACFIEARISGLKAFASASPEQLRLDDQVRQAKLERGPAWTDAVEGSSGDDSAGQPRESDWPTFRHDAFRSGSTSEPVGPSVRPAWSRKLGGRLSAPTVADGKVFVAAVDEHTVYALDENTGRTVWTFTADARVDSPPTLYKGRAYFGSADGWVYCVRASDGQLMWRYRAAPAERRVVVFGQLESAWPVHGSVLIVNDTLYCVAGRSSMIDGGLFLHRIDPLTGKQLSVTPVRDFDPATGEQIDQIVGFGIEAALNDVLSSDGQSVFLIKHRFDLEGKELDRTVPHLFCPTGFLDGSWWHRSYWVFGTNFISGWGGWWRAGNVVPAGRILALDEQTLFGYGRNFYPSGNAGQWNSGEYYRLFATPKEEAVRLAEQARELLSRRARRQKGSKRPKQRVPGNHSLVQPQWEVRPPYQAKALVVAGDVLFLAGPPADAFRSLPSWQGKRGVRLLAYSKQDGQLLSQQDLPALPVFDGFAAANGRLFLSLQNGELLCLKP